MHVQYAFLNDTTRTEPLVLIKPDFFFTAYPAFNQHWYWLNPIH